MAAINQINTSILYVVERVAQQVATSQPPLPSTTILSGSQTSTSPPPATSSTASGGGGGGGSSSPLLFFVALGFGVVFTNLWIIVGVKYCFRYNARNRALRNGEEVDPITLDTMPARPHRRRREKKLMTMDEVNERFPLSKYKNWVAARASEGLSTNGGVSATTPPSRAASVRELDAVISPSHDDDKLAAASKAEAPEDQGEAAGKRKSVEAAVAEKEPTSPSLEHFGLKEVQTTDSTVDKHDHSRGTDEDEDDDDDEHIHTAVAPELLANPGDSCAICIDTLEPDDDIRGLTCGHAFHAGCLDPWLTSRRACCPLCKADYYIPKPRPEGETTEPERSSRRHRTPQAPAPTWTGLRSSRMVLHGRFTISGYPGDGATYEPRESRREVRGRRAAAAVIVAATTQTASNTATAGAGQSNPSDTSAPARWRPRIGNPFRSISLPGRNRTASGNATEEVAQPSPSQLEAGVAPR